MAFLFAMDETNWAIKESDMQNAETLANMRSMWEAYEILPATTRDATSDHYSDGTMFRERLGELYTLCPIFVWSFKFCKIFSLTIRL